MFKKIAYSFFLISFLFSSTSLANPIYTSEDLIRAIIVDNPNRVQFILDSQPTLVNSLSEEGTLPLNVAVADENTEMVDLLMKNGADPKLQDVRGLSALRMAEAEASPLILDTINSYKTFWNAKTIALAVAIGGGAALAGGGGGGGGGSVVPITDNGETHPESNSRASFITTEAELLETIGDNDAGIDAYSAYARGYDGRIFNRNPSTGLLVDDNPDGFVRVAVIDEGVELDHPDLDDNIIAGSGAYCTLGSCATGGLNGQNLDDADTHGTNVAGIIAAEKNDVGGHGVAFNAKIIPINSTLNNYSNFRSINHAIDQNARVINASFGVTVPIVDADEFDPLTVETTASAWDPATLRSYITASSDGLSLLQAYTRLANNDSVIVYSAGNDYFSQPSVDAGLNYYFRGNLDGDPEKPANYDIINPDDIDLTSTIVTSIALNADRSISSFSNRCGVAANWCLATPGFQEYTTETNGGYTNVTGTSFSAPGLSGALAIMFGAFPHLSAEQILNILYNTAIDLGDAGVDEVYGQGLVDLDAATSPAGGDWNIITGASLSQFQNHNFSNSNINSNNLLYLSSQLASKEVMFFDKYNRNFTTNLSSLVKVDQARYNLLDKFNFFSRQKLDQTSKISNNLSISTFAVVGDSQNKNSFMANSDFTSMETSLQYSLDDDSLFSASFAVLSEEELDSTMFTSNDNINRNLQMVSPLSLMNQPIVTSFSYSFDNISFKTSFADEFSNRDSIYGDINFGDKTSVVNQISFSDIYESSLDLSLINGFLEEDETLLGSRFSGAFAFDGSAKTNFYGLSAKYNFTEKTFLETTYLYGQTEDLSSRNSLISNIKGLTSDSFTMAFNIKDFIKSDSNLNLSISAPFATISGNANLSLPTAVDSSGNLYYSNENVDIANQDRELNFALSYDLESFDDESKFGFLSVYRQNPDNNSFVDEDIMLMLNYRKLF